MLTGFLNTYLLNKYNFYEAEYVFQIEHKFQSTPTYKKRKTESSKIKCSVSKQNNFNLSAIIALEYFDFEGLSLLLEVNILNHLQDFYIKFW